MTITRPAIAGALVLLACVVSFGLGFYRGSLEWHWVIVDAIIVLSIVVLAALVLREPCKVK